MKKIICVCLTLGLILGGITVAFAVDNANTKQEGSGQTVTAPVVNPATAVAAASTNTTIAEKSSTATLAVVTADTAVAAADTAATTAQAATTTETAVVVPDMTFTVATINLSLADAHKKMLADSPGAKMADLNRQSADGVAKGYGESVQTLNQMERDSMTNPALAWAYDSSNKGMLKANRAYATAQGPKNYEAEISNLKTSTLSNYYTLKELENQVKIAKDNLTLKEKLLSNTQLKYKLGTVAKNNVLSAEIAVNEAKDQLSAAQNGLATMKMSFNQFMGYSLMQNVALTDTIKEVPLSVKSLSDSIKGALANRNEIFEAAYNLEIAQLDFKNYTAYPKNSSKYIKSQMGVLMAEAGAKDAPLNVENDVRTKYMEMQQKYNEVQTGKKSVANAKETERLTQLQYDAGLATLADVEGAQLVYYNTQLAYSKSLLEYNLAVNAYELSSGVGSKIAAIY